MKSSDQEMGCQRDKRFLILVAVLLFSCLYFMSRSHGNQSLTDEESVDWRKTFHFLPQKHHRKDCKRYYQNKTKLPFDFQQLKIVRRFQDTLHSLLPRNNELEGNTGKYPEKQRVYWELAKQPFVSTICEIGFNAGHSALVWLSANPHARLVSFDLGEHNYTRPMARFLNREFPNRFQIFLGDSRVTVPNYYKTRNFPPCDICVVDGGHTYDIALKDFVNMQYMANPKHNIVILDDYPTWWAQDTLGKVWEEARRAGDLEEFFKCEYNNNGMGGYSVGKYKLLKL